MSSLEIQAYDLLKKYGKTSPALLANKLKISGELAEKLFLSSYKMQADEWFSFRTEIIYEELLLQSR